MSLFLLLLSLRAPPLSELRDCEGVLPVSAVGFFTYELSIYIVFYIIITKTALQSVNT